ncbi:hypothetical protein FB451DRAFT_1185472 [Mycena latifolia]|nr:hypothetical protein FB451DRAFT_1185472 [Mycena latifolia]
MCEIALQESDQVINDPGLKVRLMNCTLQQIMDILNPGILAARYALLAPITWEYLTIFTTSPNEWRKKRARMAKNGQQTAPPEDDEWEGPSGGIVDDGAEFAGDTGGQWKNMEFARNATFALVFVFSIMAFTRNSGTNLFPMILGLFLEIGGTSSRILSTLSNAGACVSITTIERLKEILSRDAIAHAVNLMQGTGVFYLIFDNINVFPRRSQQRLFNQNSMIHATNAAAISLPHVDKAAENLAAKLENRGNRANATGADIMPTEDDKTKMLASFEARER